MSELRNSMEETDALRNTSNKAQSTAFKSRETSIGEVTSCNHSENEYKVYLLDEGVLVDAFLTGLLNKWLINPRPESGDLVLISHKASSDAMILEILDKGRSKKYSSNLECNPYNRNRIMAAMAPT